MAVSFFTATTQSSAVFLLLQFTSLAATSDKKPPRFTELPTIIILMRFSKEWISKIFTAGFAKFRTQSSQGFDRVLFIGFFSRIKNSCCSIFISCKVFFKPSRYWLTQEIDRSRQTGSFQKL